MAEAIEEPGYFADETTKEGYVRLKIKINGLKVKSAGLSITNKIRGIHSHPEGKNAIIEKPEFNNRGFVLHVKGGIDTEMKGAHYGLVIKQLPFDIEPADCYLKGEDGWLFLFLKKKEVYQSWEKYIRDGNLETAVD
ncbi:uncharacterized protein LOC106068318 [Biomphalaria glabrata]|uniref:Uncharacterized protein LOC106068318 n=1 Tax=Biomphalaria glabrata TaxID=6526 RepID=A0A9W3ACZ8_BIOGL|nr:uncharacterized protein LOC106068318 [Biomphalaria glabrata]XP_055885090.1 uncharacterized protein LOC106068318 [Biomphalaria glabrata]XP_055885091.1 uncharacterized protein LOC106068318 [Biomphalaria glabrata]KAI8786796.1 hypothetical protein BgiBS90_011934 [Biomphalaria glabrata]